MSSWRAFCQTVHVVALGLWLGTLFMAGAAAAVLFPTMKSLNPRLPAYAAFEGEHWRLAAGHVGQQVFLIADIVQFSCAVLAIGTFLCLVVFLGLPRQRGSTVLRGLFLAVAVAAVAGELLILAPSMNAALKAYRAAGLAGASAAAAAHQKAFSDLHPIATNLLVITALAVLGALAVGAWSMSSPSQSEPDHPAATAGSTLEVPALLKAGRR